MPHRESEPVQPGSPPVEDFPEEAKGPGGLPDGETAASMETVFWLFSLCFRYPGDEVYLRIQENVGLLERVAGEASSETWELPDHQEMQAEYVRLMVNNYGSVPATPYASCYMHEGGLLLGTVHREIGRIMRNAGRELSEAIWEPPDHVHLLLEFCAEMAGSIRRGESGRQGYEALCTIVCRYIASMAEPFSQNIREHARLGLYRNLALAFRDFIAEMVGLMEGEYESINACEQEESLCHPCP
jgi:TorA maturation chaperone TorD